jgi:hypothetical protein
MRRSLTLLSILVLAGACRVRAEPVSLALDPEVGLRVAYDIESKGTVSGRLPNGQQAKFEVTMTARRVDVVKEVSEDKVIVERSLENLVYKQDGRAVTLPVQGTIRERCAFDRQGHLLPSEDSPLSAMPMPLLQTLNLVEFIPFAPRPVEIGDTWDASEIDEGRAVEGLKEEKSVSEAKLLETYESDGMQVSLLQQTVDSSIVLPAAEGAPSKGTRVAMKAKVLQSNRIEDGCLLGVKGRLSMSMDFLDKDGKPIASQRIDKLEATMRVAAE